MHLHGYGQRRRAFAQSELDDIDPQNWAMSKLTMGLVDGWKKERKVAKLQNRQLQHRCKPWMEG